MPVTAINSLDEFRTIIHSGKVIVIDFWATWCGPCRMISPIFEQLSGVEDFSNIAFYKVDVDDQQEISQEVGIRAMPTFAIFQNGNKLEELTGANPTGLENLLRKYI